MSDVAEIENGEITPYFRLIAPFHGYVREIETAIGAFVEPNELIIEILDNHHIHIDLLVYEKDINKVKIGQTVIFKVASSDNLEYVAEVFAVGKAFEEELKAVRVHAEIENPDNELLPGMYVDARIITDNSESYVLPETALLREGDANYVFVQAEEEHAGEDHSGEEEHFRFKKLSVKIGLIDRGYAEIFPGSGIGENSIIVLEGGYYIDAEMNKGEGGHHH
ncbi:MAG: HlyD family efflux transporter periplasmic adaptor subunit [Melioribacteraceae bacterium]|nr:HlyD family efflux transporter periplasmic adaptor subunit [Melioribacteraceae bacterium]